MSALKRETSVDSSGLKQLEIERLGLTRKQGLFVKEYLVDLNATQAAVRAGYSRDTAAVIGHENLRKPNISVAIEEAYAKRAERVEIEADRVLREIACVAFSDMRDFARWNSKGVTLKDSTKLGSDATRCVAEVYQSRTQIKGATYSALKFRLHDKVRALDLLAKHLGMYSDNGGRATAQGAIALEMFRRMANHASNTIDIAPAVDGPDGNHNDGHTRSLT